MDRSSFEKLVERALTKLPGKFRSRLKNIVVEVEAEPPQEILDDLGIEHGTLYGLYQGVPLTEREWNYGNVLPDRIVIYQGPIERAARAGEEVEQIVLDTVVHEIGHYFGFDDAELYRMEDEKSRKKNNGKGRR
jgi:predicted Zn-dependent protease with MMP-like domain